MTTELYCHINTEKQLLVYFSLGECVSECFNFGVEQKHMPHHQRFI